MSVALVFFNINFENAHGVEGTEMKTRFDKWILGFLVVIIWGGRANAVTTESTSNKKDVISEDQRPVDPASSRIVWGPTALPNEHRGFKLTSFDIGFWKLDYSANANIDIGIQTAPPVGVYVLGVETRMVYTIAPEVNIGVYGMLEH